MTPNDAVSRLTDQAGRPQSLAEIEALSALTIAGIKTSGGSPHAITVGAPLMTPEEAAARLIQNGGVILPRAEMISLVSLVIAGMFIDGIGSTSQELSIPTQADAELGVANSGYMTPLRTAQAIMAQVKIGRLLSVVATSAELTSYSVLPVIPMLEFSIIDVYPYNGAMAMVSIGDDSIEIYMTDTNPNVAGYTPTSPYAVSLGVWDSGAGSNTLTPDVGAKVVEWQAVFASIGLNLSAGDGVFHVEANPADVNITISSQLNGFTEVTSQGGAAGVGGVREATIVPVAAGQFVHVTRAKIVAGGSISDGISLSLKDVAGNYIDITTSPLPGDQEADMLNFADASSWGSPTEGAGLVVRYLTEPSAMPLSLQCLVQVQCVILKTT